jgi:acetolactate synthase I/II/III large subunit
MLRQRRCESVEIRRMVRVTASRMSYARAGALGAPGRHAVALVGDAAFAMNGFEVHTAVDEHLPIIWVVLNNNGHGIQ